MMGIALSMLGIGKRIMSWLADAVRWLFKAWYRIAIAVLLMLGIYLLLANISLRNQVKHWKNRYTVEATAHITTKVDYANAQQVAADINKRQVARIESEYAAIAEKSEKSYEKRLADNRATLAKFLRSKAAKGASEGTGTGSTTEMPGEPLQATETAIIPVTDLETVADAYAQLDALIEWAEGIGEVNTAPE
ncbi:MAG: hypothetical protein V4657_07255 [Pseudomonadota bacterium]